MPSENTTEYNNENEYMEQVLQRLNALPFHRFLGLEARHYGRGVASAAMQVGEQLLSADGVVSEGPLVTLGGLAAQVAVLTLVAQGRSIVGLETRISMLSATRSGRLIAKAKVDRLRARLAQCRFRIFDTEGELVATGDILAYLLPREQVNNWSKTTKEDDEGFDAADTTAEDAFEDDTVAY